MRCRSLAGKTWFCTRKHIRGRRPLPYLANVLDYHRMKCDRCWRRCGVDEIQLVQVSLILSRARLLVSLSCSAIAKESCRSERESRRSLFEIASAAIRNCPCACEHLLEPNNRCQRNTAASCYRHREFSHFAINTTCCVKRGAVNSVASLLRLRRIFFRAFFLASSFARSHVFTISARTASALALICCVCSEGTFLAGAHRGGKSTSNF